MPMNFLEAHKFKKYVVGASKYNNLPEMQKDMQGFVYVVEVYMDNFMSLAIPVSWEKIWHIANAMMHGIH